MAFESYCRYCQEPGADPYHVAYHDAEYGFPSRDETVLFERLVLEINQAGLSWLTVLKKRAAFQDAFHGFDVDRVAGYARMSRRSFQRRLADEGTSFSALLDEARRNLAIDRAGHADGSLAALSSDLGYSGQASLSRAFRRWTGTTPGSWRRTQERR